MRLQESCACTILHCPKHLNCLDAGIWAVEASKTQACSRSPLAQLHGPRLLSMVLNAACLQVFKADHLSNWQLESRHYNRHGEACYALRGPLQLKTPGCRCTRQTAPASRQSRALRAVQPATSPFGLSQARVTMPSACRCMRQRASALQKQGCAGSVTLMPREKTPSACRCMRQRALARRKQKMLLRKRLWRCSGRWISFPGLQSGTLGRLAASGRPVVGSPLVMCVMRQ